MKVEITCEYCNNLFLKEIKLINYNKNRGINNYCSNKCANAIRKTGIDTNCAYCDKSIYVKLRYVRNNKSGNYFCCHKHANLYLGVLRRGENHWNFNNVGSHYRIIALRNYPNVCSICGYNLVKALEVHHRDGNRNNNDIGNLDLLCPTHHKEYHLGIRKY